MKAKYLRYACILIGILLLGAIALLISVAILWGTGGYGVLLFAMIYAVVAVVAIPLAVTFLVLSITKREPHRWLAACLLALSLPIVWRGTGLLFQFGEGLARDFSAVHHRQTPMIGPIKRGPRQRQRHPRLHRPRAANP